MDGSPLPITWCTTWPSRWAFPFVAYIAILWLLVPWMWFRTHRLEYVAYAVLVNVLYVVAMIPDLKQYLKTRREVAVDPKMVMETNPMGRGMIMMSEWLRSRFRRTPPSA